MKHTYKVGDRVRFVADYHDGEPSIRDGKTGTLKALRRDESYPYGIELDDERGYLLWCHKVAHIKPPVIVITSDGKTTTAVKRQGKTVLATAQATCSSKDEFDADEGARIAFERLMGRDPFPAPKPQYYNGKVVCIKTNYQWWTVGKVYTVVDGVITADDGGHYPKRGEPYRDEEDVRHAGCSVTTVDGRHSPYNEFVPLIEEDAT